MEMSPRSAPLMSTRQRRKVSDQVGMRCGEGRQKGRLIYTRLYEVYIFFFCWCRQNTDHVDLCEFVTCQFKA